VLFLEPIPDPLGRVPLFLRLRLVVLQNLVGATHNLAHNVAKAIEQSTLPVVPVSESEKVTDPADR